MLSSFEITNFRTFSHLRIERLGRVNLLVGKNNVGKTTLLEAIRFYAMGSPTALRECLAQHDELDRYGPGGEGQLNLRSLFHRGSAGTADIRLGPPDQAERSLTIRLIDIERIEESDGGYHYEEFEGGEIIPEGEIFKGVVIQRNKKRVLVAPEATRRALGQGRYVGPALVSARGVLEPDLVEWWDAISLTDAESRVIKCMSLVTPIEGITTTEDPVRQHRRTFKVRAGGEVAPLPLKSLGGGPVKIFHIAVGIEYAYQASQKREASLLDKPGEEPWARSDLFLIDEIENGVHYTVLADLWKFVLRTARQHDLQVFATSHSWDCIEGFQKALADDEDADGLLIRLERKEEIDRARAVIFDRNELPIVTRESIEVR